MDILLIIVVCCSCYALGWLRRAIIELRIHKFLLDKVDTSSPYTEERQIKVKTELDVLGNQQELWTQVKWWHALPFCQPWFDLN